MPSSRDQLVQALERITAILEARPQDVSGSIYVSSQQPLGDLTTPLWHYRRNRFVQLRQVRLYFARGGPLDQLSASNGWSLEFEAAKALFDPAFEALNGVLYFDSERKVELGDHVRFRDFFRKVEGRVNYLPGISTPNPDMDFGGLFRVGVSIPNGGFAQLHVDPDSLALKKSVEFVARDARPSPAVPSAEELNE